MASSSAIGPQVIRYFPRPDNYWDREQFPMVKLRLLKEKIERSFAPQVVNFKEPELLPRGAIGAAHTRRYLNRIYHRYIIANDQEAARYEFEAPCTEEILVSEVKDAAGTLSACKDALETGRFGFNIGGGNHHTHPDFGWGFCIINDMNIALKALLKEKPGRTLLVLDLDIHHGDGVAALFGPENSIQTSGGRVVWSDQEHDCTSCVHLNENSEEKTHRGCANIYSATCLWAGDETTNMYEFPDGSAKSGRVQKRPRNETMEEALKLEAPAEAAEAQAQGQVLTCVARHDVYTVSMHERDNFPLNDSNTLSVPAKSSHWDVELEAGITDGAYLSKLDDVLSSLSSNCCSSKPDLMVYVAGADPFTEDPLSSTNITSAGLKERDLKVFNWCKKMSVPVAVVLAGGYSAAETVADIHFATFVAGMEVFHGVATRRDVSNPVY